MQLPRLVSKFKTGFASGVLTQSRIGLQMTASVGVAFFFSYWISLPETFWAVMTTLIVMRPDAASTTDAAIDRICSTLLGGGLGLAGALLTTRGISASLVALVLVGLLAYLGGVKPNLRGAPVSALIVLGGTNVGEHSALQVALLRVAQISIGVGAAMVVSWTASPYRAAPRVRYGCARLIRGMARQLMDLSLQDKTGQKEPDPEARHHSMAKLMALAKSADRIHRLAGRSPLAKHANLQQLVHLSAQTVQDVNTLKRTLSAIGQSIDQTSLRCVKSTVARALGEASDLIERKTPNQSGGMRELFELQPLKADTISGSTEQASLLSAPLLLLCNDLRRLRQHIDQATEIAI